MLLYSQKCVLDICFSIYKWLNNWVIFICGVRPRGIILSRQRTTKMLIRLCECAGWSASLLFAYGKNRFCHDAAQIKVYLAEQAWCLAWQPHADHTLGCSVNISVPKFPDYPVSLVVPEYHMHKWNKNEPQHDKTNKIICAPSEDWDQPGH